ncbi:hypothetical protein B0I35DRAFT_498680 [Stachybotrys elegans]|uniref:Carrier domain-containing protein n=1 Tax=Stachybotrys elegans TaxID=80388 RepID=A0A8K0SFK3_9HYPO|nr:hypothetical protein B0I35DRAFT_498680 [Stachybotrys elegans]
MSACPSSENSRGLVLSEISRILSVPLANLKLQSTFVENGGNSFSSVQLQAALRSKGVQIPLSAIFTASTLLSIANHTSPCLGPDLPVASRPDQASTRRQAFGTTTPSNGYVGRMTDMQLALHSDPRNILYFEKHHSHNIPALKRAWKQVLEQEQIFRVCFEMDDRGGFMRETDFSFVWEDQVIQDETVYARELQQPKMAPGTCFKAVEFRPGKETTLIWQVHHARIDGVSCNLLLAKVGRALAGEQVASGVGFATFATHLQALQQRESESAKAFWSKRQPPTKILFPSIRERMRRVTVTPNPKLTAYLKRSGLSSLYYAAWGLVLARYSDSDNVCFGVVLSGRSVPVEGATSTIGPTINTLPLCISVTGNIGEYVNHVLESTLDLISFQWSVPSHGFSRNFSSVVNIQPEAIQPAKLTGFDPFDRWSRVISDFQLRVEVETSGHIHIDSTFPELQMQHLASAFSLALEAITEPSASIKSCLDAIIEPQRQYLAHLGNWTSKASKQGLFPETLVSLFIQAAQANPESVAVQGLDNITYGDLYSQSTRVSSHLAKYIEPGDVVCVHADGTIGWVVAIYSVLMANAVYCPLDANSPDPIRASNFTTARAKIFLTGSIVAKQANPSSELALAVEEMLEQDATGPIRSSFSPNCLAYLCFTSGSTGKPKGVQCRHEGLVAFQKDFNVRLMSRPGWKIAQFMSPGFDGSIHEVFSALSYGSTLMLKDASQPFQVLKESDAAILTPSVAQALDPAEFPLKAVYLVGEAVPQAVCDAWAPNRRLFNMYGPTEATCGATIKQLISGKPVTLGLPNPSMRIYILDSQRRLAPVGAVGEIYLAGVQVAGYISPETTFLPDSILPQYSESMYKTGDYAYWNHELMFVGRKDRQVKLRGFRIDLDDLEVRIMAAGNCKAVALAADGNDQLVAFVQPRDLDLDTFKAQIRPHIPPYAFPAHFVAVSSFPMTPVGKLDYKAILAKQSPEKTSMHQKVVMEALTSLLGTTVILESNLADLGMNSLTAILLSHRLSKTVGRVAVQTILESTTVKSLMGLTDQVLDLPGTPLGDFVSPMETEWWHKYQRDGTSSFNVTYACELSPSVNQSRLVAAWNLVLQRHQILRSRYHYESGLVRRYAPDSPKVEISDDIDIEREINVPFDINDDSHLMNVLISKKHMLVKISHIICDLTTLRTLIREATWAYHGRELAPVAKTFQETVWNIPAAPNRLSFWSKTLSKVPPRYPVALSGLSRTRKSMTGSSYLCIVPERLYRDMRLFVAANKMTLHQLGLAAVALVLQYDSETCDVTLGAPYLGRKSVEDLDVVGLFLEPLPIRIRSSDMSFVKSVQQCSQAAVSNALAWDQLRLGVDQLDPLFDVMVTFHESKDAIEFIPGAQFIPTWSKGAKFKLMVEFTARSGLGFRLEYSDECLCHKDVVSFAGLLLEALQGLTQGDSYQAIAGRLRSGRVDERLK